MVNDIINEEHEKEIKALKDDYDARIENLELEIALLQAAVNRFLNQDAPTICDQCCETKLEPRSGVLWCSLCNRGWDPRDGEWDWDAWDAMKPEPSQEEV